MATATPTNSPSTGSDTLNWLVGVGLFIGICAFIASTSKAGHALVYYSLVLLLVLIAVTQAPWIAQELSFVNFNPPTYTPTTGSGQTTQTAYASFKTPTSIGPAGVIPI